MSSSVIRFTPDIVHSYPKLYEYLSGKETERRVCQQVVQAGQDYKNNWMGTWKVVPLGISAVLQVYFSIFASAMSHLLFAFHCVSSQIKMLSYQLDILAEITIYDPQLIGVWRFGRDFLAPAMNSYSLEAADLYVQPSLLRKNIQDEKVRGGILRKKLEFGKNNGCCLGESRWFLRSYFLTKKLFENHRDQMQALGRQFSWGAPSQAALLHHLCPNPLNEGKAFIGSHEDWDSKCGIYGDTVPNNYATRCKKITENLQNLGPGAYLLFTPSHAMAFVCVEEGVGYFFDPNLGTVAIHDEPGYEKMAQEILSYQAYVTEKQKKKNSPPELCTIVKAMSSNL